MSVATTVMSALTREFYRVPVTINVGGVPVNPMAMPVEFAVVVANAVPADADWKPGSWESYALRGVTHYLARILVGDSSADFQIVAGGAYDVWMRITDYPERPVRLVGQIMARTPA